MGIASAPAPAAALLLAAAAVVVGVLAGGAGANYNDADQTSRTACALSFSQALALAHKAWDDLLLILGDRVELLAFEDTVMQQVANGDRTETAFGQEVEALLAGAAVTSAWHELQRAASVHVNWERERPRPLQWEPTQRYLDWMKWAASGLVSCKSGSTTTSLTLPAGGGATSRGTDDAPRRRPLWPDPSLVASRRSKHTLGVGVLKRFQPGQHPQGEQARRSGAGMQPTESRVYELEAGTTWFVHVSDKLVTLSDGSAWCCDVLDVLVVADQPLGPGEAVTRSYAPASARQTNIIIHIYCCTDSSPPKFVTDAGVTRCGTLRLSLDNDELARRAGDAAKSRDIVARIEFGGTELAASAQDIASGRCVRTQLDFLSTAV
ncbi:hypothetical protein FOCC_FOCC011516 [Frankliniella occidentalis]|nr:hypothetical protein FOCC_FOCC011516 [Frankliniella occidentalis]